MWVESPRYVLGAIAIRNVNNIYIPNLILVKIDHKTSATVKPVRASGFIIKGPLMLGGLIK